MFNLFKKQNKQPDNQSLPPSAAQKISNEKDEDLFDDKTVIYSMPERFRFPHLHAKNAKIVGLMILILGILFLIGGSFAVYYFLIKKPRLSAKPVQNPIENIASTTPQAETAVEQAPAETQPATENPPIATSTTEEIAQSATTTASEPIENQATSSLLTASSTQINYLAAQDLDQDGLSDKEETEIGSDQNKGDSDDDGYNDLSEFQKFYNPVGNGKLDNNQQFKTYENKFNNYKVYYAGEWKVNEVSSDSVILQAPDTSFIQIISQPNMENKSLENWYQEQVKEPVSVDQLFINEDWRGIKSKDGLVSYLFSPKGDSIYIISYNPGPDNTLYYKNFFDLVLNSLVLSLGK
jgi:hypothetical protein